jgi:hypothetical protein
VGNEKFKDGSTVMLEADLDATPRTLRFFVDDHEQPVFITHIPQSIIFAVRVLLFLLLFTLLQVSSWFKHTSVTVSLREVSDCAGRGLPTSKALQWDTDWDR